MIKKYNLSRPKKYFKDNVEKTMWQNVGVMTEFIKEDGSVSRKIEIPAIGLDCQVFPFEDRKTEPKPPQGLQSGYMNSKLSPEEEYNTYGSQEEIVNPADIPSDIPY